MKRRIVQLIVGVIALAILAAAWLWYDNFIDGVDIHAESAAPPDLQAQIERGAYLARIGNCIACHTARGGVPASGGLAVSTEFGTVYTSNLTPDEKTGIGSWTRNAFWRALHHGRSADGRLLIPVFPYTHTTLMSRADVDALYSYFASLPPAENDVPDHELRWPYGTQWALAAWRSLYFTPGALPPAGELDETIDRGAYLVHGVAHCSVCHAPRDRLGGGDWTDLGGNVLKGQGWYAPSLVDPGEASLADWDTGEIVRLLRTGVADEGRTSGPMAETVLKGLQYLSDDDAGAIAQYLRDLPQRGPAVQAVAARAPRGRQTLSGERLYERHCAECHGSGGEGLAPAYPPLAGNRAVTMPIVENLLQTVLYGGFNPATAGNPRPWGMPPFSQELSDRDIASVLSYIRNAWGNRASAVSAQQVHTLRASTVAAD